MGDRYIFNKKCPVCGELYEVYDAPSSMMYVAVCDCGFDEKLNYVELGNCLYLIPEAIKKHIDNLERQIDMDEDLMMR